MGKRVAIVTTTIFVPKALDAYAENARAHGHDDVFFVVTADKKTPAECREYCEGLQQRHGYPVHFMGVPEQEAWLEDYPELRCNTPWNCIQRRNISFLVAYEQGCDVMCTIDDDNYVVDQSADYIGHHLKCGDVCELEGLVDATPATEGGLNGYVNVCTYLTEKRDQIFYHRGYPMGARWREGEAVASVGQVTGKVMVNAGLWLQDPDVDALTRLLQQIDATGYPRADNFVLANGSQSWSPFNSQNTAVAREVLEAYFMCPCVGRMDDIWPSYFVRKIMDHLGHYVSYGLPMVNQERNPHDYYVDFDNERTGHQLTDQYCTALKEAQLTGTTYWDCLNELIAHLECWLGKQDFNTARGRTHRDYVEGMIRSMTVWSKTIQRANQKLAAKQ